MARVLMAVVALVALLTGDKVAHAQDGETPADGPVETVLVCWFAIGEGPTIPHWQLREEPAASFAGKSGEEIDPWVWPDENGNCPAERPEGITYEGPLGPQVFWPIGGPVEEPQPTEVPAGDGGGEEVAVCWWPPHDGGGGPWSVTYMSPGEAEAWIAERPDSGHWPNTDGTCDEDVPFVGGPRFYCVLPPDAAAPFEGVWVDTRVEEAALRGDYGYVEAGTAGTCPEGTYVAEWTTGGSWGIAYSVPVRVDAATGAAEEAGAPMGDQAEQGAGTPNGVGAVPAAVVSGTNTEPGGLAPAGAEGAGGNDGDPPSTGGGEQPAPGPPSEVEAVRPAIDTGGARRVVRLPATGAAPVRAPGLVVVAVVALGALAAACSAFPLGRKGAWGRNRVRRA